MFKPSATYRVTVKRSLEDTVGLTVDVTTPRYGDPEEFMSEMLGHLVATLYSDERFTYHEAFKGYAIIEVDGERKTLRVTARPRSMWSDRRLDVELEPVK